MKKVYIPTIDELYKMQDMGTNMYEYLIVKAVESLIIEGVNYPNKGILKSTYKYLRENPYIAYAICRLYPEEIKYSNVMQNDLNLCLELIKEEKDNSVFNLDNLIYFENGAGIYSNELLREKVVSTLANKLILNPRYRFEYRENQLLDDIFGRKLNRFIYPKKDYLAEIEPSYGLITGDVNIKYYTDKYASRYGLNSSCFLEYQNKDILTNKDEDVKRLIKCIYQNKNNLY